MSSSDVVAGEEPEYEEKLDEAPKSILMGMIKQLKVGMGLSRITLPAFILEPRSFLEKRTSNPPSSLRILQQTLR